MRRMNGAENLTDTGNISSKAETSAHSKCFGPSSSHSWINCPFSAIARQQIPDRSSKYAETGTLAHELCEIKLRLYFGQISSEEFAECLSQIQANALYTDDMLSSSNEYLETVKELSLTHYDTQPIAYIEQKISYDDICGADGFGTSDCILLGGDTLTVIDYKNGSGVPVSAVGNPQMRLYAYGAMHSVVNPMFFDIKRVIMCIVQPNLNSITTDIISTAALLEWIENTVRPAVSRINAGCKDRVPGKWCGEGFCPNFTQCSAWREKFASAYADYSVDYADKNTDELSNDELGGLYTKVSELSAWINKLKARIENEIQSGHSVKGWKMVEGRSTRCLTDVDAAFGELCKRTGVDKTLLYKTTPVSLTEAEKIIGKKDFVDICKPWISKKSGKPALAPESDKRTAIDRSAESDFADVAAPVNTENK